MVLIVDGLLLGGILRLLSNRVFSLGRRVSGRDSLSRYPSQLSLVGGRGRTGSVVETEPFTPKNTLFLFTPFVEDLATPSFCP